MKRGRVIGLVALLVLGSASIASSQTPPAAYRPGLGDLMMSTIQPRHIKLGIAGQNKNWPLAAFELGQMEEAFGRVAQIWPSWRSISIADMVDVVKEPMASLQQAVKAKDAQRFAQAYGQLTAACNNCHAGANRAMIVIRAPDAAEYPDQDFVPKTP